MSTPSSTQSADNRRMNRRPAKVGTTITCRKGTLGLGPDIAIKLHDFSIDGVRLSVKEPLAAGEEIELELTPPGLSKAIVIVAIVVWCRNTEDEGLAAAATFRSPLSYTDMYHLM